MSQTVIKPGGKMAWLILIVMALLYASDFAVRLVFSVSIESIKSEFKFSDTEIGMFQSIFFIGLAGFTIPVAILVDKWRRKQTIAMIAAVWNIATIATGMGTSFISILFSRFAVGVGIAGFAPGGMAWISEVFPQKKRATAIGIYSMGMILGCIIGMGAGGAVITATGDWRMAYYVIGIPGIFLAIATLFLPDISRNTVHTSPTQMFQEMGDFFKIKTYRLVSFGTGFFLIMQVAAQTWSVVLLMRAYELNAAKAGSIMAFMILPGLMAPIVGGYLGDRMQRKVPHGRPLFCVIAGFLGIVSFAIQFSVAGIVPLWGYIGLMLASSLVTSMPMPVYNAVIQDVIPADKRSTGQSIVIFLQYALFTWWGATLVGKISDMAGGGVFGLKVALLSICPITMASLLLFYKACRYYPEESARNCDGKVTVDA